MTGKILVLGSTGVVGRHVVSQLLAKGERVKAATRGGKSVNGAEETLLDFGNKASIAAALEGVDRAYVLSPTGITVPLTVLGDFVDEAIRHKVKIVVQTAIGVDASDDIPLRQLEIKIERSGVPYVLLRPNWFMDNFLTYWLPGIKAAGIIAVPAGDAKTSFIAAEDIAAAAVAALTSFAFDGQTLVLTGDESFSYAEAAKILSDAAGRPIQYVSTTPEAFTETLKQNGVPAEYAELLGTLFYPVAQGWVGGTTVDLKRLIGRPAQRLANFAATHAVAWWN